jgi:hypothetical protein
VSQDQIDEWQRKVRETTERGSLEARDEQAIAEVATRLSWLAFLGTWLSMFAAAGALVGVGPTFRLVVVDAITPSRVGETAPPTYSNA